MSIPKTIHYCWFGAGEIPESIKHYMASWRRICPEYRIKRWDESDIDPDACRYMREAYQMGKWAFVSDYVRFYALYKEGGIYLDTDIRLLRKFDHLLHYSAFWGFGQERLTVPVFGAEAGCRCLKDIMDIYEKKTFIRDNGTMDMTAIEITVEKVLVEKYGLVMNGRRQILKDNMAVLPKEYFLSRDYRTGIIKKNPHLHLIHYGAGSWLDEQDKKYLKYLHKYVRKYGERAGLLTGAFLYYLKEEGLRSVCRHIVTRTGQILLRDDSKMRSVYRRK